MSSEGSNPSSDEVNRENDLRMQTELDAVRKENSILSVVLIASGLLGGGLAWSLHSVMACSIVVICVIGFLINWRRLRLRLVYGSLSQIHYYNASDVLGQSTIARIQFVENCVRILALALAFIPVSAYEQWRLSVFGTLHKGSAYMLPSIFLYVEPTLWYVLGVLSSAWLAFESVIWGLSRRNYIRAYMEYRDLESVGMRVKYILAVLATSVWLLTLNSYICLSERGVYIKQPWSTRESYCSWNTVQGTEEVGGGRWRIAFSNGSTAIVDFRGMRTENTDHVHEILLHIEKAKASVK